MGERAGAVDSRHSGQLESRSEIPDILAVGLTRLWARKSSGKSADFGDSSLHFPPDQSGRRSPEFAEGGRMSATTPAKLNETRSGKPRAAAADSSDTVLSRLAALKTAPAPALKALWRQLFETEPPPYNRRFLESRLAYRIQELAYGGLMPATIKRLKAIAEDLDGGDPARRRKPASDRPISGTRLIREYQGVEHCVTVRDQDFEYQGRTYKSLSAIARAITHTRWNGLVFFGLKNRATPS
jgi:hypothetical protein